MKYLAIDTGGKHLSVLAYKDGETHRVYLPECGAKHSVVLTGEIENVLKSAHMSLKECDFFGVVVGPGSFTGIRIGISTVKGLCFALDKKAVSITSFDCLAYAEKNDKVLALVDAGHGYYYACPYDKGKQGEQGFLSRSAVDELIEKGFAPVSTEVLFEDCKAVDPCEGLFNATQLKQNERISAEELSALYLRKSSAEEKRA